MVWSQALQVRSKKALLSPGQQKAVLYHNIFEFPLKKDEMTRWEAGPKVGKISEKKRISLTKGYYVVDSRKELILKRIANSRFSKYKLKIAKRAAEKLKQIPTVKAVAITGSLAMENANENSDIDLMIITKKGTLWTTRLISYLLLLIGGFALRRVGKSAEKDRLCMNIWLDESDLSWKKRNVFTAHEILQTKALVDKGGTYRKFVMENSWALDYWPKAVSIARLKVKTDSNNLLAILAEKLISFLEPLAFFFEFTYMKGKITREVVTPTKALFHPYDWSRFVSSKMKAL